MEVLHLRVQKHQYLEASKPSPSLPLLPSVLPVEHSLTKVARHPLKSGQKRKLASVESAAQAMVCLLLAILALLPSNLKSAATPVGKVVTLERSGILSRPRTPANQEEVLMLRTPEMNKLQLLLPAVSALFVIVSVVRHQWEHLRQALIEDHHLLQNRIQQPSRIVVFPFQVCPLKKPSLSHLHQHNHAARRLPLRKHPLLRYRLPCLSVEVPYRMRMKSRFHHRLPCLLRLLAELYRSLKMTSQSEDQIQDEELHRLQQALLWVSKLLMKRQLRLRRVLLRVDVPRLSTIMRRRRTMKCLCVKVSRQRLNQASADRV